MSEEILQLASSMFPEDVVGVIENAGFTRSDIEHLTREDVDHEFREYKFGMRKSLWLFFKAVKSGKKVGGRAGDTDTKNSSPSRFNAAHISLGHQAEQTASLAMDEHSHSGPAIGAVEEIPVYEENTVVVEVSENDDQSFLSDLHQNPTDGASPVVHHTEYKIISKSSIQGRDKLFDDQGFSYSVRQKTEYGTYWKCTVRRRGKRGCPAAVIQTGGKYKRNQLLHNHEPKPGADVVARISIQSFEEAIKNPRKSASVIVREQIEDSLASGTCPALPQFQSLTRKVNRHRQSSLKGTFGHTPARTQGSAKSEGVSPHMQQLGRGYRQSSSRYSSR